MMRNSMVVWTRLIRTGSRTCPIGQTVSPLKLKTRELTEIISLVGILKDLYRFLYIILDELMGSTWTLLTSQMANLRVMTSASLWGVSMPWRSLSEKTQLLQFPFIFSWAFIDCYLLSLLWKDFPVHFDLLKVIFYCILGQHRLIQDPMDYFIYPHCPQFYGYLWLVGPPFLLGRSFYEFLDVALLH